MDAHACGTKNPQMQCPAWKTSEPGTGLLRKSGAGSMAPTSTVCGFLRADLYLWGSNLGYPKARGKGREVPLTVLWDLFCSCKGQKARKAQLSKRCAGSHLFMPRSHVQPCLCNGREGAYQGLIPKSQEGKKISEQFAFSSESLKLKKQSKLHSGCWRVRVAWADILQQVVLLLLSSAGLNLVNGAG